MGHWRRSILCIMVVLAIGVGSSSSALATDGPLANATVSFGEWQTHPPLDRHPDISPRASNEHRLIPFKVKIKAGGSVNFISERCTG